MFLGLVRFDSVRSCLTRFGFGYVLLYWDMFIWGDICSDKLVFDRF